MEKIAIAATFTAESLEPVLSFWSNELDTSWEIKFAPYNQVFQQLLDRASLILQNREGINVVLIRFEDWERFGKKGDEEKWKKNLRTI